MFCFSKMIIFNCDFSAKVTCAFLASKILEKLSEIKPYQTKKATILIRIRFQGYRCELDICGYAS